MIRVLISMLMLSVFMPAAWADSEDHERAHKLMREHQVLPLSDIMASVAHAYPGKVLDVELEEEHGKIVYEMKILGADGVLREIDVDARNARIIKSKVEH